MSQVSRVLIVGVVATALLSGVAYGSGQIEIITGAGTMTTSPASLAPNTYLSSLIPSALDPFDGDLVPLPTAIEADFWEEVEYDSWTDPRTAEVSVDWWLNDYGGVTTWAEPGSGLYHTWYNAEYSQDLSCDVTTGFLVPEFSNHNVYVFLASRSCYHDWELDGYFEGAARSSLTASGNGIAWSGYSPSSDPDWFENVETVYGDWDKDDEQAFAGPLAMIDPDEFDWEFAQNAAMAPAALGNNTEFPFSTTRTFEIREHIDVLSQADSLDDTNTEENASLFSWSYGMYFTIYQIES